VPRPWFEDYRTGNGRERGLGNSGQITRAFSRQTFYWDRNENQRALGTSVRKLDWVTPMLRMWDTRREQVAAAASRRKAKWRILYRPLPAVETQRIRIVNRGEVQKTIGNRHEKKTTPPSNGTSGFDRDYFFGFERITICPSSQNWSPRRKGAGTTGFLREIDRS